MSHDNTTVQMPSGNFKGSKRRSKKSEKWNEKEYYINKFLEKHRLKMQRE